MKIAVRVDASFRIGTGHVMRCLALARELCNRGAQILFICRDHPGNMGEMIVSEGFKIAMLEIDQNSCRKKDGHAGHEKDHEYPVYANWLCTDPDTDSKQAMGVLQREAPWDWLIVDHYAIDHHWESFLRQVAKNIMAIDDLANRAHDCDLLLDQNYFQEPGKRYKGLLPEHCQRLLGPKFALLRPEFQTARKFARMRGNGVARVLIYFGGNDPENMTGLALDALNSSILTHLKLEIVAGANNKHLETLKQQVQNRQGARLHIQPKYFTELLLRADLCIGAGGTTTWERLCLSLPSIVVTVAKNQEPFIEELHKAGYVLWIGKSTDMSAEQMQILFIRTINAWDEKTCTLPADIVDGKGVGRVTATMIKTKKSFSLKKK